ncbi:MAG: hypothetical protein Q7K57_46880 [Burkholderiaceae bacterium]|nr:hypothetical protein [Burkholderiaceae bacterium]
MPKPTEPSTKNNIASMNANTEGTHDMGVLVINTTARASGNASDIAFDSRLARFI